MLKAKLQSFKIGYGEEQIIFHPRMISVAEQDEVQTALNDISDTDTEKYDKEFEIIRAALGEWSAEAPQKLDKDKGEFKHVALVEDAQSALDALCRYFAERTPENERVIRTAYQSYLVQMRPEVSFL